MAKIDPRREKRAQNIAYAARWNRRSIKQRRKAKRERVEQRERAWLAASGIARDERWPLTR